MTVIDTVGYVAGLKSPNPVRRGGVKPSILVQLISTFGVPIALAAYLAKRYLKKSKNQKPQDTATPKEDKKTVEKVKPRRDYKVKRDAEQDDEARHQARLAALAAAQAMADGGDMMMMEDGEEEEGGEVGGIPGMPEGADKGNFIKMLQSLGYKLVMQPGSNQMFLVPPGAAGNEDGAPGDAALGLQDGQGRAHVRQPHDQPGSSTLQGSIDSTTQHGHDPGRSPMPTSHDDALHEAFGGHASKDKGRYLDGSQGGTYLDTGKQTSSILDHHDFEIEDEYEDDLDQDGWYDDGADDNDQYETDSDWASQLQNSTRTGQHQSSHDTHGSATLLSSGSNQQQGDAGGYITGPRAQRSGTRLDHGKDLGMFEFDDDDDLGFDDEDMFDMNGMDERMAEMIMDDMMRDMMNNTHHPSPKMDYDYDLDDDYDDYDEEDDFTDFRDPFAAQFASSTLESSSQERKQSQPHGDMMIPEGEEEGYDEDEEEEEGEEEDQ